MTGSRNMWDLHMKWKTGMKKQDKEIPENHRNLKSRPKRNTNPKHSTDHRQNSDC